MAKKGESEVKVVRPIPEHLQKALEDLSLVLADPERKRVLSEEVSALEKEIDELKAKANVLEERKEKVEEKIDEIESCEKRLASIRESLEEA